MATYQLSYGFNPDGTKNENPLKFDDEIDDPAEQRKLKSDQPKKTPTWFELDDAQNTKMYLITLPDSTTEEEFIEIMSNSGFMQNKCKIKMFRDSEGNFKGDALCSYIEISSKTAAVPQTPPLQVQPCRGYYMDWVIFFITVLGTIVISTFTYMTVMGWYNDTMEWLNSTEDKPKHYDVLHIILPFISILNFITMVDCTYEEYKCVSAYIWPNTHEIKTSAPCRSERLATLRIEDELGSAAKYAGKSFKKPC